MVQGYRGTTVRTLRLPVSPSTCQRAIPPTADPHTVPPYTYHINVCRMYYKIYFLCYVCSMYFEKCLTVAQSLVNPFCIREVIAL